MANSMMRNAGCALIAGVVLGGIGYGISIPISDYYKHRDVTFTVDKAERVCDSSSNGDQTCRYLVYTSAGTFEDSDSIVNGKFNSSDVYGQIQSGHTYRATVYGWRNGVLSWYPNIVSLSDITKK